MEIGHFLTHFITIQYISDLVTSFITDGREMTGQERERQMQQRLAGLEPGTLLFMVCILKYLSRHISYAVIKILLTFFYSLQT